MEELPGPGDQDGGRGDGGVGLSIGGLICEIIDAREIICRLVAEPAAVG